MYGNCCCGGVILDTDYPLLPHPAAVHWHGRAEPAEPGTPTPRGPEALAQTRLEDAGGCVCAERREDVGGGQKSRGGREHEGEASCAAPSRRRLARLPHARPVKLGGQQSRPVQSQGEARLKEGSSGAVGVQIHWPGWDEPGGGRRLRGEPSAGQIPRPPLRHRLPQQAVGRRGRQSHLTRKACPPGLDLDPAPPPAPPPSPLGRRRRCCRGGSR